ncbi:MAG TPA: calcium:proton antiporter [Candidatus Binatia bacterium]|nr:calcium:proton antiporter [Candidatus Binatia bacterium]
MIALVSAHRDRKRDGNSNTLIRAELCLFVGLGTTAIFFGTGSRLVEIAAHPVGLTVVFLWLFAVILWSAVSVTRHADCLAIKWGEPYGTLVLTLSAITIEVVMVSTAMLHGENNPTLGRDSIFSVIMIALNGFVGLVLLLGGLRHGEQYYNLQGVNSYLNVIMTMAVLGLVLPNFTTTGALTFSREQKIFLVVMSLSLYAIFLLIQTMRHKGYFTESEQAPVMTGPAHHPLRVYSTAFHAPMLLLYLVIVILLAEKFAIPLDNSIEKFGMPQEFGGAMIAALVLTPEGIGAVQATLRNQLQRSINILLGSVLATIGLTIPAVLTISLITKRPVTLGVQGGNLPLLLLTLAVSVVTFTSRKTNILQGCVHLLLFAVFVLLIFAP